MEGQWEVANADEFRLYEGASLQHADISFSVRLRALFRIHQAPEPYLKRVRSERTCLHLAADGLLWSLYQEVDVRRLIFSRAAAIAHRVPGYEFYFDQSLQTVEVLNREFGPWDTIMDPPV